MIKCNQCLACPSAGPCFRTACRHLLCEKCAKEAFTSHSYCPSCNTQLRPQDVVEFLIGVPPVGLHETIFQIALQDTAFEAIVENCNKVMQYVTELMAFVQSQILMEQQTEASARAQIEAGHDSYKNESSKALYQMREQGTMLTQRVQALEQQIEARDRELNEMREAYQSKVKKCAAWEKAYNTIKEQAMGGPMTLDAPQPHNSNNDYTYGENTANMSNMHEITVPGLKAVHHTGAHLTSTDISGAPPPPSSPFMPGAATVGGGTSGATSTSATMKPQANGTGMGGNWMQRVTTTETMRVVAKAPHHPYSSSTSSSNSSNSNHPQQQQVQYTSVPPPVYRPQVQQQQQQQYQQYQPQQQQYQHYQQQQHQGAVVVPLRHRAPLVPIPQPPSPYHHSSTSSSNSTSTSITNSYQQQQGRSQYFFDRSGGQYR